MIDLEPRHLQTVLEILKMHVPECEVRVFGSRVTGKAKPYSDLDLAIVGESRQPREVISALQEEFAESDLPFRVDVLDWHGVSENFRKIIENGYEVIQSGVK